MICLGKFYPMWNFMKLQILSYIKFSVNPLGRHWWPEKRPRSYFPLWLKCQTWRTAFFSNIVSPSPVTETSNRSDHRNKRSNWSLTEKTCFIAACKEYYGRLKSKKSSHGKTKRMGKYFQADSKYVLGQWCGVIPSKKMNSFIAVLKNFNWSWISVCTLKYRVMRNDYNQKTEYN